MHDTLILQPTMAGLRRVNGGSDGPQWMNRYAELEADADTPDD